MPDLPHFVVRRQRAEADFRYGLVRLRDNTEGVALSGGEATEQTVAIETNDPERPRVEVKVVATVVATRKPSPRTGGAQPE